MPSWFRKCDCSHLVTSYIDLPNSGTICLDCFQKADILMDVPLTPASFTDQGVCASMIEQLYRDLKLDRASTARELHRAFSHPLITQAALMKWEQASLSPAPAPVTS